MIDNTWLKMGEQVSDLKLLGFILASDYRTEIISMLGSQMATPKQLSKVTCLRIGHVSNVLKRLVEKQLIECVNPDAKRGRIYRLTPTGKSVFDLLSKIKLSKS